MRYMNQKTILTLVAIVVFIGLGWWFMTGRQSASSTVTPTPEQVMEEVTESPEAIEQSDGTMEEEQDDGAMEKVDVTIENFAYTPKIITIKKGESVTWTNNDSVGHTATGDEDEFDTGILEKGESKTITFDKTGTYTYHCTPHPNMKGTVVVE